MNQIVPPAAILPNNFNQGAAEIAPSARAELMRLLEGDPTGAAGSLHILSLGELISKASGDKDVVRQRINIAVETILGRETSPANREFWARVNDTSYIVIFLGLGKVEAERRVSSTASRIERFLLGLSRDRRIEHVQTRVMDLRELAVRSAHENIVSALMERLARQPSKTEHSEAVGLSRPGARDFDRIEYCYFPIVQPKSRQICAYEAVPTLRAEGKLRFGMENVLQGGRTDPRARELQWSIMDEARSEIDLHFRTKKPNTPPSPVIIPCPIESLLSNDGPRYMKFFVEVAEAYKGYCGIHIWGAYHNLTPDQLTELQGRFAVLNRIMRIIVADIPQTREGLMCVKYNLAQEKGVGRAIAINYAQLAAHYDKENKDALAYVLKLPSGFRLQGFPSFAYNVESKGIADKLAAGGFAWLAGSGVMPLERVVGDVLNGEAP